MLGSQAIWGDCSADLHNLVQTCESESWVEHLCRSTERDCEPVQETVELLYGSSTSSMSPVEGGGDLSTGEGGREETRRCREGGEGAQRGAEGAVDGVPEGARVGKEVQMPYGALNIEIIVL